MKNYYNINTFERKDIDENLYNYWIENNNPKASQWLETPSQPSFDPKNENIEWINGSWSIISIQTPHYSAEEWLTNQGYTSMILLTLLDLETKLKEQSKTSVKLTTTRAWINNILSEYIQTPNAKDNWVKCPYSPQETIAESFLILNN